MQNEISNLLTLEAALLASVDPMGEIQPITNSFLILGNKLQSARLIIPRRSSGGPIWYCCYNYWLRRIFRFCNSSILPVIVVSHISYDLFNSCWKCNPRSNISFLHLTNNISHDSSVLSFLANITEGSNLQDLTSLSSFVRSLIWEIISSKNGTAILLLFLYLLQHFVMQEFDGNTS